MRRPSRALAGTPGVGFPPVCPPLTPQLCTRRVVTTRQKCQAGQAETPFCGDDGQDAHPKLSGNLPQQPALAHSTLKRVLEIRGALAATDGHRRAALRALLAGRRLRVGPDPDRGFRVAGLLEVVLETTPPPRASVPEPPGLDEDHRLCEVQTGAQLPSPPDRGRLPDRHLKPGGIPEIHVARDRLPRTAAARPPIPSPRRSRVPGSGMGAATAMIWGAVILKSFPSASK